MTAKPAPGRVTLFADGGSRGNPGPAAGGAVLVAADGTVLEEVAIYLGTATNNVAEWHGLLKGLEAAAALGIRRLAVRLDSELVVRQLTGIYRVKHADLIPLHAKARRLVAGFDEVEIAHVPRAQNKLADAAVNRCLDDAAARGRGGPPGKTEA
jgi:probable phosphoglycerate mutase